jgi:hypothetical protein
MALPTWPDGVRYVPDLNSISEIKRYLDPLATEMEGGNIRQRSRPGDNVGTLSQTIVMPRPQFETFTAWVKTTLNNGTARFTANVWLNTGFQSRVCQFVNGAPADKPVGSRLVAVSMTLRVYDI